jgi:uncharacterized membrane protein
MTVESTHIASAPKTDVAVAPKTQRLASIDMLRGVAMMLMALDHSAFIARTILLAESYGSERPELGKLPHVLSGLLTNLASGIFFVLAGTSVSFFERSRRKRGWTEWEITRFLSIRAFILLILDQIINTIAWQEPFGFYVLSAIAFCLFVIAFVRLLPLPVIAALTIALFFGYPLLVTAFPNTEPEPFSVITTILLQRHMTAAPYVDFPLLSRLSLVLGGYVFGRLLLAEKVSISPRLLWVALIGFVAWFVLRLLGGYGNFLPYQPDWPLIYFLIESKQPPSLTFFLFNLSWAVVMLVILKLIENRIAPTFIGWVLQVFGQTALFFYVAHLLLYSQIIGPLVPDTFLTGAGIVRGYFEFSLGIVIMIPICAGYRQLRRKYPIFSYL